MEITKNSLINKLALFFYGIGFIGLIASFLMAGFTEWGYIWGRLIILTAEGSLISLIAGLIMTVIYILFRGKNTEPAVGKDLLIAIIVTLGIFFIIGYIIFIFMFHNTNLS